MPGKIGSDRDGLAELHEASSSRSQPIVFDGLRGWLHQSCGETRDTGVVLIAPLGRDARCAYAPMRLLADKLAAAGYPTLRYDHLGTGDSSDLPDEDGDALVDWREGVAQAIATLRARTGVRRVVLGGLRFGATVAAISAELADGLILLAPVLSGRSWLRRMRFTTNLTSIGLQVQDDDQLFDAGELCFSKTTIASISDLDLAHLVAQRGPVFVAAQNAMVSAFAAGLANRGGRVEASDFTGFKDLFVESHSNLPPHAVFDRTLNWLRETFPEAGPAQVAEPATTAQDAVLRSLGAVERIVHFGPGLVGVLCEPEHAARQSPAVLFCSTGGDPRSGVAGFATRTARQLARRGITSLRFDYSGLGDSPMIGTDPRCHVFETPREAEMDAAIALLAERGHGDITLFGVCAGAYHALRTAWRNPLVMGVFAVSPVKIVWRAGDTLTFGRYKNGRPSSDYVKAVLDMDAWREAMRGKVDVLAVLLTLAGRLRGRIAGWATRRGPTSPLARMGQFSRRGGRACLVMGVNDASIEETETHFGTDASGLTKLPNMSVEIAPQLDHGLASNLSRQIAYNHLVNWLTSPRSDQSAVGAVGEAYGAAAITRPAAWPGVSIRR